jgi:hypothetical protein
VRRLALGALLLALAAGTARAGGDFTDVSAGRQTVWAAGDFGVDQLDARSGRVLRQFVLPGLYPLSVAVASGAAWVASVADWTDPGTLTRIDAGSGRRRVLLGRHGTPQAIAVGDGSVWVQVAEKGTNRVLQFGPGGRLRSVTGVGTDGWLTADGLGAWVCCHDRTLLRIDRSGQTHSAFSLPTDGPVWAAAGSIWFPGAGVLDRLDERTGRARARIPLEGAADVAAANGSVYALGTHALVRIDAATDRVLERRTLPGIPQSVSATADGVWVSLVQRPATSRLYELDPQTLRVKLRLVLL